MNQEKNKIKSFTDLKAWQEAYKLVLMIYKITKYFPKEELFGLINQMRRASVSISSNIAEGFSRDSFKDKIRFYYMSQGSVTEIQNQLFIAKGLNFINQETFTKISNQTITVHKIINGLIKSSKKLNYS